MRGTISFVFTQLYSRCARYWYNSRQLFIATIVPSLKKTTVRGVMIAAVVFCFLSSGSTAVVHAQTATNTVIEGVQVIEQPLGLPSSDIRVLIARIIRVALGLLGTVFLVLLLYGGYLWMTAGGNPEQIESSKKILINATIGIAIILSAYAIVLLVMRLLGIDTGALQNGPDTNAANQNYVGSGALGQVVKDHYPSRDQINVPRNSKIIITFYKPIKVNSVVVDKNTPNGQPAVYGDCVNIGPQMDWEKDCDTLNLDAITITRSDTNERIRGAAILASYENGQAYSIVIRPYDYLGSDQAKIAYKVRVTDKVRFDNAASGDPSIFANRSQASNFYEWQFICDTVLDMAPPHVVSTLPQQGETQVKNSVIQIFFNDALDPTGIQGSFAVDNDHYVLTGGNIFLKTNNSTVPLGTMRLTNGYHTLEFTPSVECGQNACGGKVYCLNVCDKPGAQCKQDDYDVLLKAARTFSNKSFDSIPFSGIMDVAGNALDGSAPYGDKPQAATTTLPVYNNWKQPDNFWWNFTIKDELDLTSPYLRSVKPGVSDEYIAANAEWSMTFSKPMRIEPMYSIGIDEKPASLDKNGSPIPLCHTPRVDNSSGVGFTRMDHCPFIDTARHYYYPLVDSQVEDVHFNCFYPGEGPKIKNTVCDTDHPQFCCGATSTPGNQAFCCNGMTNQVDKNACLSALKADSP